MRTFVSVGTGLIYAAIVAAWAAYLVPLWLRRNDEAMASRATRGDDDERSPGRVVAARRVAVPGSGGPAVGAGAAEKDLAERRRAERRRRAARAAARAAARRRRRTLTLLVLATATVAVLAAVRLVPWWSTAIPAALVVGYVLLAILAVRRARRARRLEVEAGARRARRAHVAPESKAAAEAAASAPKASDDAVARTVAGNAASGDVWSPRARSSLSSRPARPSRPVDVWDPVPVPLPTYVHKAKAPRTVRTIDLSESWLTGLSGEGSAASGPLAVTSAAPFVDLPEAGLLSRPADTAAALVDGEAAGAVGMDDPADPEPKRAVGD